MAKYTKIQIGHYKRKDGTKIKPHTRLVKSKPGRLTHGKKQLSKLKGRLRKAERSKDFDKKARIKRIKALMRHWRKALGNSKRGRRLSTMGV